MDKIRVLLGNHPMMIPDLIREMVAEHEEVEIVAECRGPMTILQEIGRTSADAVILAQEGTEEPGICSQLLAVYPDLTIISVKLDMTCVYAQQLCSRRRSVANPRNSGIIEILSHMVKHPCHEDESYRELTGSGRGGGERIPAKSEERPQ